MTRETPPLDFDTSRAEFFESLGHPTRMKILKSLEDKPLTFTELKREVGIVSNGHMAFHLGKLRGLVATTGAGTYALTDDGREAIHFVERMGSKPGEYGSRAFSQVWSLGEMWKLAVAAMVIALIVLSSSTVYLYQGWAIASNDVSSLKTAGQSVCQQVQSIVTVVTSDYQNVTVTLQLQIASDQSMISTLNSTRPSGYQDIIAMLQGQIGQDNNTLSLLSSEVTATGGIAAVGSPCSIFYAP